MFNVGDKIICKDNTYKENDLDIGGVYDVVGVFDGEKRKMVDIAKNGVIFTNYFYAYRFMSLKEARKYKLNKLKGEWKK